MAWQVVLDSNGVRCTVAREDLFAPYDAQAVLHGLRQSRGAKASTLRHS